MGTRLTKSLLQVSKPWLHAASALAVAGCAAGRLSPVAVVDAERLPAYAVGAATCGTTAPPATASRKLVPGDRIRLGLFASGIQFNQDKNTYPPLTRAIVLNLRRLDEINGRLDADEQAVLATYLQVNRSASWKTGTDSDPAGFDFEDRLLLAKSLQENEAKVWNAFVDTLCLVSANAELQAGWGSRAARPALVLEADMQALCDAVEQRSLFAEAFLDAPPGKDCAHGRPLAREPMNVSGLTYSKGRGWASAALDVLPDESSSNYYGNVSYIRSPIAVFGDVMLGAVRPFRASATEWTLREWEASGICGGSDERPYVIRSVTFRGGAQGYRILADGNHPPTHRIVVRDGARTVDRLRIQLLDWSLSEAALDLLRADDVDAIDWGAERDSHTSVRPEGGCGRRGI